MEALTDKIVDGRWHVKEYLGRGASGIVYRAVDNTKNCDVALKFISLKGKHKQKQKIKAEIDILLTVNHPNLIKILSYNVMEKEIYMVLEYMNHGSLGKLLKQCGSYPENLAAIYMHGALQGLRYLHDKGFVHCDIKSDNILISNERVCLSDLGIAKKIEPQGMEDSSMEVEGTPYWMAPEVILMTSQTSASDIWSIGCTIIELLTGSPPYGTLTPMAALFRMVQEDHPPMPEGISQDTSKRATAESLLEHEWLKQSTAAKHMDVKEARQSISVYLRRPTITGRDYHAAALQLSNEQETHAKNNQDLEDVEKKLSSLATQDNQAHVELEALLEKMMDRANAFVRRVERRKEQEAALVKLGKLYGKWLKDEKENCEKQLKIVQDSLYSDMKSHNQIQQQIRRVKETIYVSVYARIDSPQGMGPEWLNYKKDDLLLLIADHKTVENSWLAEHVASGKRGLVARNNVEPVAKKTAPNHNPYVNNPSVAEGVLTSIQLQNRSDKLNTIFGTSQEPEPHSPKPSFFSSREKKNTAINLQMPIFGRLRDDGRASLLTGDTQLVYELLSQYPDLVVEGRQFSSCDTIGVKHADKDKEIEKAKEKPRVLFLFNNLLIITKRNTVSTHNKYFKLLVSIQPSELKITQSDEMSICFECKHTKYLLIFTDAKKKQTWASGLLTLTTLAKKT